MRDASKLPDGFFVVNFQIQIRKGRMAGWWINFITAEHCDLRYRLTYRHN
jgi:hypothetical protein